MAVGDNETKVFAMHYTQASKKPWLFLLLSPNCMVAHDFLTGTGVSGTYTFHTFENHYKEARLEGQQ